MLGVQGARVAVLRVPILCVFLFTLPCRIKSEHGRGADMAPLHRTQTRQSISCWTSCRTSRGSSTGWTTTRRASRPTCSTLPAFSSALHVSGTHSHRHICFFVIYREAERPKDAQLPPVIHYSAEEPFTKYEICLVFARILGLPHAHIIPDAGPPPPGTSYGIRCYT